MTALRICVWTEWFKLRRSRPVKTTLIAMCVTPPILIGIIWLLEREQTIFPRVLELVGACLWLLAGLSTLLLTAGQIGSEFELDTVRAAVGRGVPRWVFIVGKGLALLGVAVGNALTAWFCGGLAALTSHLVQAGTTGLGEGIAALLTFGLAAVGVVTLTSAAYIGLTLVLGVLTRSSAFTLLGGLGVFLIDFVLEELGFIGAGSSLGLYSIMGNTTTLLSHWPHLLPDWKTTVDTGTAPGTAALILTGYALFFTALACGLFQQQDLNGKE